MDLCTRSNDNKDRCFNAPIFMEINLLSDQRYFAPTDRILLTIKKTLSYLINENSIDFFYFVSFFLKEKRFFMCMVNIGVLKY